LLTVRENGRETALPLWEERRSAQHRNGAGSGDVDELGRWSAGAKFSRGELPTGLGRKARPIDMQGCNRTSRNEAVRDAGGAASFRGDARLCTILAGGAVAGIWRGRKSGLGRSGEGLRITHAHTDAGAQPNGEHGYNTSLMIRPINIRACAVYHDTILGLRAKEARKFRSKFRHLPRQ